MQENTVNVEVLRIKAVDLDLIHTDNWLAVFEFVSGNEAGFFSITTDTKTNEGIIMIRKVKELESQINLLKQKKCDKNTRTHQYQLPLIRALSLNI